MNESERYEEAMAANPSPVFVFGSNERGQHAGGAARAAYEKYGAIWGGGEGAQGQSYAIPTISDRWETLPLRAVRDSVRIVE